MPQIKSQLAELLLESRFHQPADWFRSQRPFSPEIEAVQAVLFSPKHSRQVKIATYRGWLEKNQPCVFGKTAATNKSVYICLLEDQEILRMTRGDADVRDTIQDHRQVWKRLALEGRVSSFLILLTSKQLVLKEPNDALKEICRRLLELYMEIKVPDDSFETEREYVFLRRPDNTLLKFSTLPNIFCAQGDGRWWHDHRTPGGIMVTSNALGHFVYARSKKTHLDEATCTSALEQAMRTIAGARKNPSNGRTKYAHCPATTLVARQASDPTPLRPTSEFSSFSTDQYLRIVPISRAANSSHGALSEDWSVEYHSSPEMRAKNQASQALVQYADLADIVKMLDRKGGGSLMGEVNEAQRLVSLPDEHG